jgi:hypothetical protein
MFAKYFILCVIGWHSGLPSIVSSKSPFYSLIPALYKEAKFIPVQVKLVKEKKLKKRQKARYRTLQATTFEYWDTHKQGRMSPEKLLRKVSRLYGPIE